MPNNEKLAPDTDHFRQRLILKKHVRRAIRTIHKLHSWGHNLKNFLFLKIGFALSLSILASCQTAKPIGMTVSVTPTASGITGGDVLSPQRNAGQDIPQLKGSSIVTVRSFEHTKKADDTFSSRKEIERVSCELKSDGYQASFLTPAQVNVPDYGYASRPIMVRCDHPGFKTGYKNVEAFDKTSAQMRDSGSKSGLLGFGLAVIVDAASDRKKHDFVYPPIEVDMNTLECEKSKTGCH
jgi:hypothetical protein